MCRSMFCADSYFGICSTPFVSAPPPLHLPICGDSSVGRASDWTAKHNTDAGSSPRCGKGFFFLFLPESAFNADYLTVSVQPPCAIACINNCVHLKNPKHRQPYHCLDTWILHALIGMGSAALAAAVLYSGRAKSSEKVTTKTTSNSSALKKKVSFREERERERSNQI